MQDKIYKYFSADIMNLVFQRKGFAGIKCSLPNQYNDPYELFLGVDTSVAPDLLATYNEIVQELPQLPTTCFSNSPCVTPMWAHYAANHTGFVLEFDVDQLKKAFEEIDIRDVNYKDAPNGSIQACLERMAVTKKPRHAVWLRQTVLSEAYFSKQKLWSYEQECRLVDFNKYIEDVSGNKILFVPLFCVSSIIFGKNFRSEQFDDAKAVADKSELDWYKEEIGKIQPLPFFTSKSGSIFIFSEGKITKANFTCDSCSEPVDQGVTSCSWCAISDSDRDDAARGNPFRVLQHYGLLDEYFNQVGQIERNYKKKL